MSRTWKLTSGPKIHTKDEHLWYWEDLLLELSSFPSRYWTRPFPHFLERSQGQRFGILFVQASRNPWEIWVFYLFLTSANFHSLVDQYLWRRNNLKKHNAIVNHNICEELKARVYVRWERKLVCKREHTCLL